MICSINKSNLEKLTRFCDKDNVFACEIYSSLKTYGKDCSWVYVGFDNKGENVFCGVKAVSTGYMVYSQNLDDEQASSLAEFFMFMPKKNIIANKKVLEKLQKVFGGEVEEKLIMKRVSNSFNKEKLKTFCNEIAIHPKKYDDMFEVLTSAFKNDCPKELRDDWIYTTSLKERKAGSKVLVIYKDIECVSCGFLDSVNSYCGVIASVATKENYKRKGYGTKIITSLLSMEEIKNKSAYVVLLNNNLENFYKKLGFEISDKYCILKY